MLTIKKILFAADFVERAVPRLSYALALAERLGAEVHVFHSNVLHGEDPEAGGPQPSTPDAGVEALKEMTDAAAQAGGRSAELVSQHVIRRSISAGPAILDYAAEEDVDLIILGTHGRRGFQRMMLGSVAEEVIRLAKCPVLTVRAREPRMVYKGKGPSILVPIDFSKHSRSALQHAVQLASVLNARLSLLHVVEETLHPAFYGIALRSIYDADPEIESKAVKRMKEILAEIDGQSEADFEARPGSAAREIAAYAEEKRSDMIVIGTHGLTGLEHFLMGSTTERVVRRAECPVFTVKSFGKSVLDSQVDTGDEIRSATGQSEAFD